MAQKELRLIQDDPWLSPYSYEINARYQRYKERVKHINKNFGSLIDFSATHLTMGLHYNPDRKGWVYREWAPAAEQLWLIGDFNNWENTHPLVKTENGIWELFVQGKDTLQHESKVKVRIKGANGTLDRIPAYITRAIQDPNTYDYAGQIWKPKKEFTWSDNSFDLKKIGSPVIYECHLGMAQEKEGIGSYIEFADNILPRIKHLGYNTIQIMAIQEHPYYGSFGYHVSNFFAPSSRFGTPEDLKYLVNKAHKLGIAVVMDIVHSHAVKNIAEGLNNFDGSGGQYFHEGERGNHSLWDSKVFNYGKEEVQQFLLSNLRYWLEEFHFDGFRFDGVTSMLYLHHGAFIDFDHYDKYFKDGDEWDAITYLQLANALIHEIKPNALSIAEDMSGMPGLCRKIEEGGVGFDYRLAMGIPDYWIKTLKHKADEEWDIHELWGVLNNRRFGEKTIAYAESHDQALVGDKTLAFWLMDKEMYWHMHVDSKNIVIDRGIALHKMIRLFTIALGGEGYLNFIGNEFGHPEWIDFPREGNDWSYKYARRQWSLVDNPELKYKYLNQFDKEMIDMITANKVLSASFANQINMDSNNKVIIFERNNLIFVFNFHPTHSISDYKFFVPKAGKYKVVLNSDNAACGGFDRIDENIVHHTYEEDGVDKLSIYITNRTALVLKKIK